MKYIWMVILIFVGSYCNAQSEIAIPEVNITFAVFSDPHYYDPSLGTDGEAFSAYLKQDRKLLKESRELAEEALKMIGNYEADFLIIPGDLTKDGTKVSHTEFAKLLNEFEKSGKQVYVVPGNHDIANGEAKAFPGDSSVYMENISPTEFEDIYANLGYGEALYRDTNSLSYVTEPAEGLWLLGLDACLYRKNEAHHHPHTGGEFTDGTLEWLDEVYAAAVKENKMLLAFMHHGVLEHYKGQEKYYGEYLVGDYMKISKKLASMGVRVVFTGHYHAQDITMEHWKDGSFITDVETGSLVTYPCPVREVNIQSDSIYITSRFIDNLPSFEGDFPSYSRGYAHSGIAGIAEETMVDMKLKREDAAKLSGQIGDAFISHYQGDEVHEGKTLDLKGVGFMGRFIIHFRKNLIKGLHADLFPADNNVVISLEDGSVR